jgi:sporadic carbohydrate cluster 2OG-Fe(II) oxygenase
MSSLAQSFDTNEDPSLVREFLEQGYVIRDVDDRAALDSLRRELVVVAAQLAGQSLPADDGEFLDQIQSMVPVDKLNAFRLGVYREMNERSWFRPTYFKLTRRTLESLVGNELAMQNRINFSIQMPNEQTSLLDIHADVFSGETPYQVVQWLPLVDVWDTKSMFILPRPKSEAVVQRFKDFSSSGMSGLYKEVEKDLIWLNIPYGKVLIFCPNFLHGNVVNREATTRWSMNCRFTGLFTPYNTAEKSLGSFYLPITVRPVTQLGMAYRQPGGYQE